MCPKFHAVVGIEVRIGDSLQGSISWIIYLPANFCCGMTARQAYERGFKVVFGSDITSTDDPQLQEPELKVLRKGFAKVLSLAEIIRTLD